MNQEQFRAHAVTMRAQREQKLRDSEASTIAVRKQVETIFTVGCVALGGLGIAFLLHAPWLFAIFFIMSAALWPLHAVMHFRAQRVSLRLGFLKGAEWEWEVWAQGLERAAMKKVNYTGESTQ